MIGWEDINMNAPISLDMNEIWIQWFEKRDEAAANELIAHYMYLVDYHVERVAGHIPDSYDKSELKSLGLIGLFDALQKFEPDRNLKFDTYATIRIRGSIMDGLRKEDWLPRALRDQVKKVDRTTQKLEQKLKRTPTSTDLAKELGMEREEIESIMSSALFANIVSLEATMQATDVGKRTEIAATIEDEQAISPHEHLLNDEIKIELAENIKMLNENEQLVISLFYQDELTLTEIGQVLNLTTSRISQIHKRAIFKLRNTLSKMHVE